MLYQHLEWNSAFSDIKCAFVHYWVCICTLSSVHLYFIECAFAHYWVCICTLSSVHLYIYWFCGVVHLLCCRRLRGYGWNQMHTTFIPNIWHFTYQSEGNCVFDISRKFKRCICTIWVFLCYFVTLDIPGRYLYKFYKCIMSCVNVWIVQMY